MNVRTIRARVRPKGQITLPPEVREELRIKEGDEVQFELGPDGVITLRGMVTVPADQAWFWTPEWQAGEREADEDIRAGRVRTFHDIDEMFDAMDQEIAEGKA